MKVLVTGANGFIGRYIVDRLRHEHFVIGCGSKGKASIAVDQYLHWDLRKPVIPSEIREVQPDVIVHAAACISSDNTDVNLALVNCLGTQQVYNLAVKKHVKKVIYISSLPVTGAGLKLNDERKIDDDCPPAPLSMYHATKAAGEMIIGQLKNENVEVLCLRISSPIAPGMSNKTIVSIFLQNARQNKSINVLGNGSRRQNYIDARDIAEAVVRCVKTPHMFGIYNLTSKSTVSNAELAVLCKKTAGSNATIIYGKTPDPNDNIKWDADCSKLIKEIGEYQFHSLAESLLDILNSLDKKSGSLK